MELDEEQRSALRTGSKQVRRVAAILRSVNPESFRASELAKRVVDQVWSCRTDEPSVEEVVQGFAGLLRYLPALGPGTQAVIQNSLERLMDRMGLSCAVNRALQATAQEIGGKARGR